MEAGQFSVQTETRGMSASEPICTQCNKECEPVILEWDEPVEFWGMRSVQKFYTVDSHCCRAEVDLPANFSIHDYA